MNIIEEANSIVNNRSQEQDRQYGPFNESMDKMADIFNSLTGLNLTAIEMFKAMIALKLSREAYCHKEDGLLDLIGYIGAMNNYINDKEEKLRLKVIDDDLPF